MFMELFFTLFALWISTKNPGQIILRNVGEFYVAPLGQIKKIGFVIVTSNNCQGVI